MNIDAVKLAEISKYESLCFCCLTADALLNDLLNRATDFRIQLVECYTICSGIVPDLERPIKICCNCEDRLKSCFKFRELCRASYQQLTENLEPSLEFLVDIKHELLSGDEDFICEEVIRDNSHSMNEVFIKSEHHRNSKRAPKKVKKYKKLVKEQNNFPATPEETSASDLEVDFLCLHCDIFLPTHREYKKHYEQHRAGNGYKRISRVCEICQEETSTFVSHMLEQHRDYKPYKCKFCVKQYRTSGELRIHLNSHITQNQLDCHACHEKFNAANRLRAHIFNHENPNNEYLCPICGQAYDRFKPLHEHAEDNHGKSKLFPCTRCKKVFMVRKTCLDHLCPAPPKISQIEPTFKCLRCDTLFATEDDLFCHEIVVCNEPDEYDCETCGKTFSTKIKLQNHIRIVHVGRIKRICEICGHGVKDNTAYTLHMAGHEPERAHKCNRSGCKQAFKHKNLLRNHLRLHEVKDGIRPKQYECHYCKKTFIAYANIKRHMAVHSDSPAMRPFQCAVCGKRMQSLKGLDDHMFIHSGVKTVACKVCPRLFPSQGAANTHYESSHVDNYYLCKFCDVKVKKCSRFREHLFKHRDFNPYVCSMCPTQYTNEFLFKRHLRNVHQTLFDEKVHKYVEQEVDWIESLIRECKRRDDSVILMPKEIKKATKRKIRSEYHENVNNSL